MYAFDKKLEAVSIAYDENRNSPNISAKASEDRAKAIIDMANELGIYVHKDERLLEQLKQLKEGEEVPKELYTIIATILAFSYILQGKTPSKWKRIDGSTAINSKV